jgi:hypothetical protein
MASFISALSLFILILSHGCFTLPIINQQLSSSTSNNDLTTEQALNLRVIFRFFFIFDLIKSNSILVSS